MSLSRRQIRAYVAERIVAVLGPAGWVESRRHVDRFATDSRQLAHLSFAVGVGISRRHGTAKPEDGAVTSTTVRIRWCHKLRTGGDAGETEDVGEALDAEEAVLWAALDASTRPEVDGWFETALEPKASADGTMVIGELQLTVGHLLPLQAS